MSGYYAVLMVVRASDEEDAHETARGGTDHPYADEIAFVGDPWAVVPTVDDDGFETPGCIAQLTEASTAAAIESTQFMPDPEGGPNAETIPGTGLLASDRIAQNSARVVAWCEARAAARDDARGERDR